MDTAYVPDDIFEQGIAAPEMPVFDLSAEAHTLLKKLPRVDLLRIAINPFLEPAIMPRSHGDIVKASTSELQRVLFGVPSIAIRLDSPQAVEAVCVNDENAAPAIATSSSVTKPPSKKKKTSRYSGLQSGG